MKMMNMIKSVALMIFVLSLSSCKPIGEIFEDKTAPQDTSVSINSGADQTNSLSVTLTLEGDDATQMFITNTAGCSSGGSYEAFAATKAWTLGTSNGTATVYVKFKDRAGNESACVSDTIVHDNVVPTVSNVTSSTANGSFKVGDTISIQVNFSESMTVTGTPQLTLETGATDRAVNYATGSGTSSLTFTYTVQSGDTSSDLDYTSTTALALNSGTIRDGAGNNATLTLATPGAANSLGANKALVVDTSVPTVSSVNSSTANGSYKVGDSISIQVNFSENVTVSGTPQLTLETGATDRAVNYASGSGTSTLNFTYTVQSGDTSSDLDYTSTTALALNGGTIRDAALNNATLTLATPGTANSLGFNKALVVDTTAPTVASVNSSTANGSYKVGDSISIQVNFSESVTVTGTPQLTLETGATDQVVDCASGTGTSMTCTYTVQSGDTSSDLDYTSTTALALNGGTIRDAALNNATLTLATPGAANSLGANKALVVDTSAPTVSSVNSSTANGSYKAGDSISIQVNFSESVTVTGTPQLTLETGATDQVVDCASGTGTSMTCTYTVQSGDTSSDLDYTSTTALALNGGTIQDAALNNATLALATPGAANSLGANKAIVVDTSAPTVTSVDSSTVDGTYKFGDTISIQVNFSESVTVTGTPQLTLETGTTDQVVNCASGTGTSMTCTYTVQPGDNNSDLDYTSTTALALNGGTIQDAALNNATLTLATPGAANSLGFNKALVVDTTAPTVASVNSSTANGSYKAGDIISIQVNFSESVTVTGTPQLTLETGATDQVVDCASGTGSSMTCTYTVQSGDNSGDLDYTSTTALALNGGTIQDAALNNATLTLATPGAADSLGANKALVIDTIAPTAPSIAINNGDPQTNSTLVDLTLAAAGASEMYITNTAGCASGGSYEAFDTSKLAWVLSQTSGTATVYAKFKDLAGNETTCESDTIEIAPRIINVTSSSPNGIYTTGETISIQVVFESAVTVSGTPTLTLETGTTDAVVSYASGSTTNTLTFNYTVASGENSSDLSYVNTSSLSLPGGATIKVGTIDVNTTLPTVGAAGSLSANKALVVDTEPVVSYVTSNKANGTYGLGEVIPIHVVFSENVTVNGVPQLTLETGVSDAVVTYVQTLNGNTLVFNYTVAAGHESSDLDYKLTSSLALNGGTIRDSASNDADITLPAVGGANSLGGQKALVIDTTPIITNVTSSTPNGTYVAGNAIAVDFEFSESVTVTGTPTLTMETGATDRTINCASGTGTTMTCTYTVQSGDTSLDLDYVAGSLTLGGGVSIKDASNNDLDLSSLPVPGAAHSLSANKAIVIDPVPVVTNVTSSSANGTYAAGTVIPIQVSFSEDVSVGGAPTLTLETGASDAVVTYSSGSGSSTLTFNYTVGATDSFTDLDYVTTTSLDLNGGTIESATLQAATLTLAAPGASGSLGNNKTFKSLFRGSLAGASVDNEAFGSVLASGDLNGDGKPDLAVGFPNYNGGDGRVIVYDGTDLTTSLLTITGSSGENLGAALAFADVDNDTKYDLIVGSPLSDGAGTDRGKVEVYSGDTGLLLYSILGSADGDKLGSSVSRLGNIDGSSGEEFIVGIPFADVSAKTDAGMAKVYKGADGSPFTSISGNEANARLGSNVSGVGDVDNDGTADFMIAETHAAAGGTARGRVRVYSGDDLSVLYVKLGTDDNDHFGASLAGGADVNNDGRVDFMIGSPDADGAGTDRGQVIVYSGVDGSVLYTKTGSANNDQLGYSIALLGNVDGAVGNDFIIGIPGAAGGGTSRGQTKVFSGDTGNVFYTLNGDEDNGAYGRAVIGLTPGIEADTEDDFAVGAPLVDGAGTDRGKVFVYR